MERHSIFTVLASVLVLAACDASSPSGVPCDDDTDCVPMDCNQGMCFDDGFCGWSVRACTDGGAADLTAETLCADRASLVGQSVRVEVDFDDTAWRGGACTAAACPDGPACCNHCEVVFQVPCGTTPIRIRASAELELAPTDFGPYEPMVTWSGTGLPGMATLGCLGCETGVSCSPSDPATIRAVVGRIIEYPPPATGYELRVDAIEL